MRRRMSYTVSEVYRKEFGYICAAGTRINGCNTEETAKRTTAEFCQNDRVIE